MVPQLHVPIVKVVRIQLLPDWKVDMHPFICLDIRPVVVCLDILSKVLQAIAEIEELLLIMIKPYIIPTQKSTAISYKVS